MSAIHLQLDLANIHADCNLWALWFFQWQGVMRSRDLIKLKHARTERGLLEYDKKRGRIGVSKVPHPVEKGWEIRVTVAMKPSKNFQERI